MTDTIFHLRVTENKDWVLLVFTAAFALLAITKSSFQNRFSEFSGLLFSKKYLKIYKDNSFFKSSFSVLLFLVQLLSVAFFILMTLHTFGYASKTDWVLFVRIVTFLIYATFFKFLVEKIIANTFNIDEFVEQFNFQKFTFRNYIALFLLPINVILFYHNFFTKNIILITIIIVLISSGLAYVGILKNHQKSILSKLLYFILYLCTFEIAPYYFMYYWFTKNIV